MKKVIVSIIVIIIFLTNVSQFVYAAQVPGTDGDGSASASDNSWVKKAFSAAKSFINENPTDDLGIVNPIFEKAKIIIKAINTILMVLLMGISIIALSITGVRYIASGAAPAQKEIAKKSLHTIFIGMAIGFGAYVIWRIAMSIVEIIIDALA